MKSRLHWYFGFAVKLFENFGSKKSAGRRRRRLGHIEDLETRALLSAPAGSQWQSFGASPSPGVIITFGPNGSINVQPTGIGPYDGADDTYVGVVNNSGKTLTSLKLSADSSRQILAFDGDGIQNYGSQAPPIVALTGYEGPDSFFSNVNDDGINSFGTVNFIGKGLASGQQTYFSLEGPPQKVITGVDLSVAINDAMTAPTQAMDLHLNQFFKNETIQIPVAIANLGAEYANGSITLETSISRTPDAKGIVASISKTNVLINVAPAGQQTVNLNVLLNNTSSLVPGQLYFLVVKLNSNKIVETDSDNGIGSNNVAASASPYKYLGAPSQPAVFNSGIYFNTIRETLRGTPTPFALQGVQVPMSGAEFTAAFESPGGYNNPNLAPYQDSKGIPTIGIGVNIATPDKAITSSLASRVRSFYHGQAANNAAGYKNIDKMTDNQVLAMLRSQASVAKRTGVAAPDALTKSDAQDLFDILYNKHQQQAAATVGQSVWNSLPSSVRWVLADIDFNVGSLGGFKNLLADLKAPGGPDLIKAGFDLMDAKRTLPPPVGVQHSRILAGYSYLVAGHTAEIGKPI